MKMKIIASISIFLLLFSLAWLWEQQNTREFYEPKALDGDEEIVEIMPLTNDVNDLKRKRYEVFKSREYVRIEEL